MIPINPSVGGSAEGWELIDAKMTEDGDTVVNFTGLHGNRDSVYKVFYVCHMSVVGEQRLLVNGDNGANYDFVSVTRGGTSEVVTTLLNETEYLLSSASVTSEQVMCEVAIQGKGGNAVGHVIQCVNHTNGSGGGDMHPRAGRWESSDEVTSISIHANLGLLTAGRFGAGSVFELYRMTSS